MWLMDPDAGMTPNFSCCSKVMETVDKYFHRCLRDKIPRLSFILSLELSIIVNELTSHSFPSMSHRTSILRVVTNPHAHLKYGLRLRPVASFRTSLSVQHRTTIPPVAGVSGTSNTRMASTTSRQQPPWVPPRCVARRRQDPKAAHIQLAHEEQGGLRA